MARTVLRKQHNDNAKEEITMKIIGYRRSDFVTKEGRPVTGCRIYLATEIASQNGGGRLRQGYVSL